MGVNLQFIVHLKFIDEYDDVNTETKLHISQEISVFMKLSIISHW